MQELHGIEHNAHMITRQTFGAEHEHIPWAHEGHRIAPITAKPDFVDMRHGQARIIIQQQAPAMLKDKAHQAPTIVLGVRQAKNGLNDGCQIWYGDNIHTLLYFPIVHSG